MRKLISLLVIVIPLVGCSTIPTNGSVLNQKVSQGIHKNQVETEKIITALADVERAVLDKEWDNIYVKVETSYLKKNSIAKTSSLTQAQRRAISANAAQTYYGLLGKISEVESNLLNQTRANTKILVEMNDEVTRYLLSLEELDSAQNKIQQKLSGLIGIDISSLSGLAKKAIGGI